MRRILLPLLLLVCGVASMAQEKPTNATPSPSPALPVTKLAEKATPLEMAQAAFQAHGGENLRTVKNLLLVGSVDVYSSTATTNFSGKFVHLTAGEKMRREINAPPAPSIRIIDDGQQVSVSLPGVQLPPSSYYGLYTLQMFDQQGYVVGPLQGQEKKKRGFSITTPAGTWTDFYLDPNTSRVIGYSFVYHGYLFGSELKKHTVVNGILGPFAFTEALNLPMGTFYVEFKVKEAKTDTQLDDDVFAMPAGK